MLNKTIAAIRPLHFDAMEECQVRLDNLTKPLGSLHSFEHIALQIAGITGDPRPQKHHMKKSIVLITSGADTEKHAYKSLIDIFAAHVKATVSIVDIGDSLDSLKNQTAIARQERVLHAIETGIQVAHQESDAGTRIIGIGTIGRNSDATMKIFSAALSEDPPDANDPLDWLYQAGSLEVAALVGVILGAASKRIAVVLDGPDTSAAALIAVATAPPAKDYLIGSHVGVDPLHQVALAKIGVPAYLHLDLQIGQGVGAVLGMSLIHASLHILNDMKTFGEADVAVAQDGPGSLRQDKNVR